MNRIFVYDPTLKDKKSAVRGIGRYLQILKESFGISWIFTDNLRIPADSVFINPFFNFLQPPLTLQRIAKKQIAVIHDLIPLKYPVHFPAGIKGNINIALNKYALQNYDLIITDSEASKKDIIKILKIKEEKIKVIYPCLPKVFSMKYKVSSIKPENAQYKILNTRYCLYVGDATWNKNLVNLARAIKIADVNCVFVGKVFELFSGKAQVPVLSNRQGPLWGVAAKNMVPSFSHFWQKELKEFYVLTKDDKRFIFKGFVTDKELINLYQQAKCNILPSRDEGFGFSYVESASQNCLSILADIPVLREISDNKAIFFDPENVNKLANSIKEIFSDQSKQKQIKEQAKNRSLFFSPSQFRKSFLKLLQNM